MLPPRKGGCSTCPPHKHKPARLDDDTDGAKSSASKRATSAPPVRRNVPTVGRTPMSTPSSAQQAGALDEDTFTRAFEDVPKLQIYSPRELEDSLAKFREILSNANQDWEQRVDAIKRVRSALLMNMLDPDDVIPQMRLMVPSFQLSVKDLRSQVVREACITVAFMSQMFGPKMETFMENMLQLLINLIPNSAKIMASSGTVCVRFVIQHVHSPRLIPILTANMASKSNAMRKACCEFLDQLLHTWPTHCLEKHVGALQDAVKKGISDADSEARACARKAFWGFHDHFRDLAEKLLNSLDASKQKMLAGEQPGMSQSSSSSSLHNYQHGAITSNGRGGQPRSRAGSTAGSNENLSRIPSLSAKRPVAISRVDSGMNGAGPLRSTSAIDYQAVQRAKVRPVGASSGYGTVGHATGAAVASAMRPGSNASLPRPTRRPIAKPTLIGSATPTLAPITTADRSGRSRSKMGVSQSQPSSRSGSPSSRLSYATYRNDMGGRVGYGYDANRMRRGSIGVATGGALSTGTSRETSPSRNQYGGYGTPGTERRKITPRGRMTPDRYYPNSSYVPQPVMAEKILQQSREAEAALADALIIADEGKPFAMRRRYDPFNNESDESETSSVCSERSYSNSSYARSIDDVNEIIGNLSSQHWADRKEGLIGLQNLFKRSTRILTPLEIKRITEIFTKMFLDPHTKVFSLFLDTLTDLVMYHKNELHDWLYVLLTRLFLKLGMDLLGSVQSKVIRTLDFVRDNFPHDLQLYNVLRFLTDPTQTPNLKVKLSVLTFIQQLCQLMDPTEFTQFVESKQAVTKIITWSGDQKSAELRKCAQLTIIAMFNHNPPDFTLLLNSLQREYQEMVTNVLSTHLKRGSLDSTNGSSPFGTRTPTSPMTPRFQTPNSTLTRPKHFSAGRQAMQFEDTENLNPEEVYNSLRKTTAEIQSYTFDTPEKSYLRKDHRGKDRDNTSQDSGISQMSVGRCELPDDRFDTTLGTASPIRKRQLDYNAALYQMPGDTVDRKLSEAVLDCEREVITEEIRAEQYDHLASILTELTNHNARFDERKDALANLNRLVREGCPTIWEEHFKTALRLLLETLTDCDGVIRALALRTLCELLRRQSDRFSGYAELTILKILESHKDTEKDVVRAAELCGATLVGFLPTEHTIRVLVPLIMTGDFPINQAAIKMLTKVVEQDGGCAPIVEQFLPDLMPGLIRAYDNPESSVRKASVFCMVALHCCMGEVVLQPYTACLNGSKLKLLNLYIKRAQQQNSGQSSQQPTPTQSQLNSLPTSPKTGAYNHTADLKS